MLSHEPCFGGQLDALAVALRLNAVEVGRHDIGSVVLHSFAARYPAQVSGLVPIDVAPPDASLAKWPLLPGIGVFIDDISDVSTAYLRWFVWCRVPALHAATHAATRPSRPRGSAVAP